MANEQGEGKGNTPEGGEVRWPRKETKPPDRDWRRRAAARDLAPGEVARSAEANPQPPEPAGPDRISDR